MPPLTLRIRNYRAIPFRKPLEIEIGKGITFFLGTNNVGKSNLIKMFFELRPAFASVLKNIPKETVSLSVLGDELFNQGSDERATRGLIAASHSLGLARSTADRIFTVEKGHDGVAIREFGDIARWRLLNISVTFSHIGANARTGNCFAK